MKKKNLCITQINIFKNLFYARSVPINNQLSSCLKNIILNIDSLTSKKKKKKKLSRACERKWTENENEN